MKLTELNIPKSELLLLMDEWVYNVRNKRILLRKIEGFTYEEVAEEFNLSTVRVKEIVKQSENLILKQIKKPPA